MSRPMRRRGQCVGRWLQPAMAGLAGLVLTGCSMANSAKLLETGTLGCHSDLGAYFLPREILHVQVRHVNPVTPSGVPVGTKTTGDERDKEAIAWRANPRYEIALIETRTVPDRSRGFCLDYLGSRMSHDYLEAKRVNGVLHRISTSNRNYVGDGTDWTKTANTIDSEDVTSTELAQRLINKSFEGANPDKWQAGTKYVAQPWLNPEDGTLREGVQGYGEGAADPRDQRIFCKLEATEYTGNEKAKKFDVLRSEVCDDKPGTEPGLAPLRPYFPQAQVAGRNKDPVTQANAQLMRRLVFLSPRNTPLKPSGAYLKAGNKLMSPAEIGEEKDKRQHNSLWTSDTAFSADFDPSRPAEAAVNNSGLRDFGLCLILNDGTVDLAQRDAYCNDPLGYAGRKGWHAQSPDRFQGYVSYQEGILYRPRLNYTLYVFRREKIKGHGHWKLEAQHVVSLSNLAPMVSVGVKRTLFASRNTIVEFDRGALVNIAIKKDSELLYGLDVPLALVKRIGELPTNIVQIRIRNTDATKDLATQQQKLLEAEREYNQALRELQAAQTGGDIAGGTNGPTTGKPQ